MGTAVKRAPVSPPRPPDALEALLRQVLAGQVELSAKLDTVLSRLPPGPRDNGDVALVGAIAAVSQGLPVTASALVRRRDVGDEALARALAACDIDNAIQLGKLLKRLEGHDVDGWRLVRVSTNREGIVWCATRVQE